MLFSHILIPTLSHCIIIAFNSTADFLFAIWNLQTEFTLNTKEVQVSPWPKFQTNPLSVSYYSESDSYVLSWINQTGILNFHLTGPGYEPFQWLIAIVRGSAFGHDTEAHSRGPFRGIPSGFP